MSGWNLVTEGKIKEGIAFCFKIMLEAIGSSEQNVIIIDSGINLDLMLPLV